VITTTKL